jgi:hypothetical protein
VCKHLDTSVPRVLELDVEQRVSTVQESLKATDQIALCGTTQCYLPPNYVLEVAPTRTKLCPKFFKLLTSGRVGAPERIRVIHEALSGDEAFQGMSVIL